MSAEDARVGAEELDLLAYEAARDMDEAVQGTLTGIEWRKRIEKRARKLAEDAATLARDTARQRVEALEQVAAQPPWEGAPCKRCTAACPVCGKRVLRGQQNPDNHCSGKCAQATDRAQRALLAKEKP